VFAGLALVAVLLVSMVGADLILAQRVAVRTAQIVDDDQRSIELVDDLREQAERLATPGMPAAQLVQVVDQIASDVRAYERLTSQPGEREQWQQLLDQIGRLQTQVRAHDFSAVPEEIGAIRRTVARLAVINREAARLEATAIRSVHNQAIWVDMGVGLLALGAVAAIVAYVLRIVAQQRALLLERNRELDAFAGRAAHDLRVPLNPIRGYADLLMTGQESPESVRRMAERIRQAVDRMTRVVEDMLELSRAGQPSQGAASPRKVAEEVLEELAPSLKDASVENRLSNDPVACASSVLAVLLRNLLTNAVKFRSRQRPLVVELSMEVHPLEVELRVEDNGIGMNAEDAAHAFEPHYRGSEAREVPGHGLGLAIVQRTMEALGGSCQLSRSHLEGTAVTLRLPRQRA
jgi:signal transduction histidine kinase